jgi:uncharacterized metal-binding protein
MRHIRQHELAGKVCPLTRAALEHELRRDLAREVGAMLDLDGLAARLAVESVAPAGAAAVRQWVVTALGTNPHRSWDGLASDIGVQHGAAAIARVRQEAQAALRRALGS